ncbi:AAA family ATPase [Poseidonibacter sp.]|uniref:AAA family ATPase n=1 Tax=Poseidonibacter sp. TaxID=2321188 RepID=UPI003C72CC87
MQINNFHIDSIHIENYKKYDFLDLELKKDFMLIIGENGSGKTSVLDAVATLLGGYLQAFKDIPSVERHSITKSDIKIDIIDKDENITVRYNTPVLISGICNINNEKIDIKRTRQNTNTTAMTKLLKSENKNLISIVKSLETDDENILPIISYHGTGRLWEQANKKSSKMEKLTKYHGYKDCLNAKSNYRNFISWFEKLERHSFNIRKEVPILEAVRNNVIKMMTILTKKEVELFIYREDDLEIKYKNEERREKISTLSDGYRNIIGIVSDIAYRMAVLNAHLGLEVIENTPGVVLIDEIDLHLHPKWQKEIVNILTLLFPKVQFIATSHSPFIIQSQTSGSIIKLDESNEPLSVNATELSIEDISEDIQNIQTPQMSSKKLEMLEVAKEYFDKLDLLEQGNISKEEVEVIKNRLDEVSAKYDDNMAYVAFLERKRLIIESKL